MYVDLHIHSYYSDGTMSPAEIIQEAKSKGLDKIAITDHNEIRGLLEGLKLEPNYLIPGVELDTLVDGIDTHILAYNFSLNDKHFLKVIEQNRLMLERVDDELITKLIEHNYPISLADYEAFTYDRRKGGWKALQYLIKLGIISSVEDCFKLMQEVGHSHAAVPFLPARDMIEEIHQAGGLAVLAHPGKTFPETKMSFYLQELLNWGIDGIEAYYPAHSYTMTNYYLNFAKEHNLIITCGCDCHGSFQKTNIGQVKVDIAEIYINSLIKSK